MNKEKFLSALNSMINQINTNNFIRALMEGMIMVVPLTIAGSFFTLAKVIPIQAYQDFLINNGLDTVLNLPLTFTSNMMGLLVSFTIAYALAGFFNQSKLSTGLTSMVSFLIMSPVEVTTNEYGMLSTKLPLDYMGAQGMFTAILTAFILGRLFIWLSMNGPKIKMPETVPPYVANSFSNIIPGFAVITVATLASGMFKLTPYGNVHNLIYGLLQVPLQGLGSSIVSIVLIAVIGQLLWFFGIHGSMVTLGIVAPLWMTLDLENLAAFSAGQELPHIAGMTFWGIYSSGNLIPFAIMLAFMAKSSQYRTLGKLGFAPSLFTIGEPIAYGVPLVMNFVYAIPYIFVDAAILLIAYMLTSVGILPKLNGIQAPAGTPLIVSGFITGGWRVAIFQVVSFIIRFAAWWPFFKLGDKRILEEEKRIESEQDTSEAVSSL